MDILISSNLERLLYDLCGRDDAQIREWFGALSAEGRYEVTPEVLQKLREDFYGGCCSDEETLAVIGKTFREYGYLCDTHTAVGVKVYEEYAAATGDSAKTIIASTASPYKFTGSVLKAISDGGIPADDFEQVELLARLSGTTPPASLLELKEKKVRFDGSVSREEMVEQVLRMLR